MTIVSVVRIGRPVVVDMRECTYMDCATIGVFVRAAKNLDTIDAAIAPIEDNAAPPRLRVL